MVHALDFAPHVTIKIALSDINETSTSDTGDQSDSFLSCFTNIKDRELTSAKNKLKLSLTL